MTRPKLVDLHVHSTFSDGSLSPEGLAGLAAKKGISALAITDHDSLEGWEEKKTACAAAGIECVCGVEISCEESDKETHILSLLADPFSPARKRLDQLRHEREHRMLSMLGKLREVTGIEIGMADLDARQAVSIGRPHLARALVARGVVKSVSEAFYRYLRDNGPIYIQKTRLPAAEGIALAKELGGLAILAHPGASGWLDGLDRFVEYGLDGVEAYHPKHDQDTVGRLLAYCRDRNLAWSGGSDFHSPGDGPDIGAPGVSYEALSRLRERRGGGAA